jgi:hypothetical protein
MPFVIKHSGDLTRPLVCTYTCPTHGEFDTEVERDANGDAPDEIGCPIEMTWDDEGMRHWSVGDRGFWYPGPLAQARVPQDRPDLSLLRSHFVSIEQVSTTGLPVLARTDNGIEFDPSIDIDTLKHVATWTPTPIACRVRRVEVVRGNYEKPERKTYLDTRKLGEGQDPAEFQAERKKIWNEERHRKVKELLR